MKRYYVVVLGALLVAVALAIPATTDAGRLFRLSAEANCCAEAFAPDAIPVIFYSKTVTVPTIGDGTGEILYVTFSSDGDQHVGNGYAFGCDVDGAACVDGGVSGIKIDSTVGDQHDQPIVRHWCAPVTPGSHTVTLTFATDGTDLTDGVFIEHPLVLIDASRTGQGPCDALAGGFVGF